jgi:zinc protease
MIVLSCFSSLLSVILSEVEGSPSQNRGGRSFDSLRSLRMTIGVAFAVFFCFSAQAEEPEIHEFTLENGLEVVIIEDHRIPVVSHNLLLRFGAADDPRGKSGLAHYMEHMLFQGTKKQAPNSFSKQIAAKGGKTNAFTTADYTGYWVNIAREHLPLVMELEADRWENLQSTKESFAREKQVILEERRSRVDNNPGALYAEQMNAALYLHHPYGTPIIGWAKEMQALDQNAVMHYYKTFHSPKNAVLVLSGDIEEEEARELIERYYGEIEPRGLRVGKRVAEPPQLAARRLQMQHPRVKQPQWDKVYVTPSYGWKAEMDREHIIPLMIADYLLGGSKTGRLYQRLVEKEKLAQSAASDFNPFRRGPGEFSLSVTPLKAEGLPKIEQIIVEELSKLSQNPPSGEELARAKAQLMAGNIYLRDGLQSLARVMGHLKMIGLPLDYYKQWEKEVEAVTAEQVSESLALLEEPYSLTGTLLPEQN